MFIKEIKDIKESNNDEINSIKTFFENEMNLLKEELNKIDSKKSGKMILIMEMNFLN